MKKFPKTLFVARELEGTQEEYLAADEDVLAFANLHAPRPVGVYELQETAKLVSRVSIEKPNKR
jgi:hypothetical protein